MLLIQFLAVFLRVTYIYSIPRGQWYRINIIKEISTHEKGVGYLTWTWRHFVLYQFIDYARRFIHLANRQTGNGYISNVRHPVALLSVDTILIFIPI